MLRIGKGCMWHSSCPSIQLRIKALDKRHFINILTIEIIPLVVHVRPDRVCLSSAVRVDQSHGHEVRVRDAVRVRDGERVLEDLLDRSPNVDDGVASFEKFVCFLRKMMGHAVA